MAGRDEILGSYDEAKARNEDLTPTEFMLKGSPGNNVIRYRGKEYHTSYRNSDSARRQFSKLETGEISGTKLYQRGEMYEYRDPSQHRYLGKPQGLYFEGLWKANVYMSYENARGEPQQTSRSFVIRAPGMTNRYQAAEIEAMLSDEIEAHIEDWTDAEEGSGEIAGHNVSVDYVEIEKIQTTTKTPENIVVLDMD
jgi:hypothetical protein